MNIVFNINHLGLLGLGATLTSLLRNCSDGSFLKLWFLCSNLKEKDKENIRKLLQNEDFKGKLEFVDFNAKQVFGHLKSLHGDWSCYGRLLIPSFIKEGLALYLDSDLIIQVDILQLKEFKSKKFLSAVRGGTIPTALDNPFFLETLKWQPDIYYFNSGVLLFNNSKWNENNVDKEIEDLSNRYSELLISHDQTLLNAVCKGEFDYLPRNFNIPWPPTKLKPAISEKGIIHFIGSPKPWDFLGKIVHHGYELWNSYTTPFWNQAYNKMTFDKVIRTWRIRRSLGKNLKIKLLST